LDDAFNANRELNKTMTRYQKYIYL
jgi:hypothetical protein